MTHYPVQKHEGNQNCVKINCHEKTNAKRLQELANHKSRGTHNYSHSQARVKTTTAMTLNNKNDKNDTGT